MGRGRKRLIEQSQKKPKICKDKQRGELQWWDFDGPNNDDNKNSVFLPEDLVEAVKRINSQQRAELLLKKPLT